jgi:hypothetical protein
VPRAEAVHALVQNLADLGADAEGEPRRIVPRLANGSALPHQLAVLTNDLLTAGADAASLDAAATAIATTARDLD